MRALSGFFSLLLAATPATAVQTDVPAFSDQTPPPAPDYSLTANWAAGPFGPGASAAMPGGATPAADRPRADVFYVHPTTFRSTTRWNQDVADAATNRWTDVSVIARQASVFNGCCRVFAPRYRQASFLNKDGGREKALDLAYGDVARAFDLYLETQNHGRPFILAGHSQGSFLIARLISEKIEGTPLEGRMIAAYVVGMNLAEGDFGRRFSHVVPCATPSQTGCVVQWNSVLPSVDLPKMAAGAQSTFVAKYGDLPSKTTLCINPLTFDRKISSATLARSKGAVPGDAGEGTPRPLNAHSVAAHCDQGMLVVEPNPELALKPLPGGGVMHYHDFGLFYADVRANATRRVTAWLKMHRKRK